MPESPLYDSYICILYHLYIVRQKYICRRIIYAPARLDAVCRAFIYIHTIHILRAVVAARWRASSASIGQQIFALYIMVRAVAIT